MTGLYKLPSSGQGEQDNISNNIPVYQRMAIYTSAQILVRMFIFFIHQSRELLCYLQDLLTAGWQECNRNETGCVYTKSDTVMKAGRVAL